MFPDKFKNILLLLMALLNIILLGLWWVNRPGENKTAQAKSSVSAPSNDELVKLVTDKLHFDSGQKTKLSVELTRHFQWMSRYHDKESADRKLLMENFTLPQPDSLLGVRYSDSLAILRSEMGNEMYRHFNFIHRLCKPEQIPYFQSFMRNLADSTNHLKGKSSFNLPQNDKSWHFSCIQYTYPIFTER